MTSTIPVIAFISSATAGAGAVGCAVVPDSGSSRGVGGAVGGCSGWALAVGLAGAKGSRLDLASEASGLGVGTFLANVGRA
ncbi:hypothetical protein ASPVEDRAFT_45091 [Aspergillus versicolor CBS 583.65]|uniref:Uncharacterized protein n=1 Tax=Aspergillus versicolor CBS 583.65 TaxID=1036611 RepID=A0A1L9PVL8_ASPVE|nr:uncharacterized protein ASPVEDRAFT_45091 [Aspergillus versicolor CBS 583.65]OJJ05589.1 hypothetical protein ASPVEDRAFT_45091 [Aspergillus versicolor CBS 583.65]